MQNSLARFLNDLAGLGIAGILAFALAWQIALDELPCPLCLLQRLAFAAIGVGICLNIVYGLRPSHFGMILLSAMFGVLASSRQVLLHIAPGTGAYGSPFWGLHFYTWALLLFLAIILAVGAFLFLFDRAASTPPDGGAAALAAGPSTLGKVSLAALIVMTGITVLTTFAECGPVECPDDPTSYWLFD